MDGKRRIALYIALFLVIVGVAVLFGLATREEDRIDSASRERRRSPGATRTVSVIQSLQDSSAPVEFFKYTRQYQKVAQTFTAPVHGMLSEIAPFVDWHVGNPTETVRVRLLALEGRTQSPFRVSAIRTFDVHLFDLPRGSFARIPIQPPIVVTKGRIYGFIVEVRRRTVQVGIGHLSYRNPYPEGVAWYYTRQVGANGEIVDNRHSWQSRNDDLAFAVTFVPFSEVMEPRMTTPRRNR